MQNTGTKRMETCGLSKSKCLWRGDQSQPPAPQLALPPGQVRGTVTGSGPTTAALPACPCDAGGIFHLTNTNALPSCSQVLSQELHSTPGAVSQRQGLTVGSGAWDASVPQHFQQLRGKLFNSSSNRGVVVQVIKTLLCST